MKIHRMSLYFVTLLFLSGCAGSPGHIQFNQSLSNSYKDTLQIEEFNYYYCGTPNLPHAVVGIDKKYKFNDRVWYKINTLDDLFFKINHLSGKDGHFHEMTVADILEPTGGKIGVWFSYYFYTVITVNQNKKTIDVLNPSNYYPRP